MKVLIYAHAFAPSIGGVETYTMQLAQGLAGFGQVGAKEQRRHRDSDARHRNVQAYGEVTVTVATQTPGDGFDDSMLPFRVVREPRLRALWQLLNNADVVHLAGPVLLPLALGLLQQKPIVIEHHGYQAVCPNGLLFYEPTKTTCPGHFMARRYHECLCCNAVTMGWLKGVFVLLLTFLRRWLCKQVAINTPISHHVLKRLQLPRSQVVYYGVPTSLADMNSSKIHNLQSKIRGSQLAVKNPPTFAYVGRLVSEKGLPLLLESARRLKDEGYVFHLEFIGEGPERPKLETITDATGLRGDVQFTGFLQGEVLQKALEDVAAIVMPSVWEETAGLAAMEQMMRGRLVIAADTGGLGEIVGEAGLKFPPGDVSGLAECMRQVLEHTDLVTELGARARERALHWFRQERMIEEHVRLYRRLLQQEGELPC